MRRHTWLATLGAVLIASLAMSTAHADQTLLPMTQEQLESANASFGGTSKCLTTGSYDATSLVWTQSGACADTGLRIGSSPGFVPLSTQARLAALVDNSGDVLGGAFTLFGTIPDLGLPSWSLLAAGRLLDVNYGRLVSQEPFSFGGAISLIALDYVADPLASFGSVLAWTPYANMTPWNLAPGGTAPWSVSATSAQNFTGSTYTFFDSAAFAAPVPEPATYALFGVGLLTIVIVRRRARRQ